MNTEATLLPLASRIAPIRLPAKPAISRGQAFLLTTSHSSRYVGNDVAQRGAGSSSHPRPPWTHMSYFWSEPIISSSRFSCTHISSKTSPNTPLASGRGCAFGSELPAAPVASWKKDEKFSKKDPLACSCSNSEAVSSVKADEGLDLKSVSYSARLAGSDKT